MLANNDGSELTVDVHSVAPEDISKIKWVYAFKERPLFRQRPDDDFWYTYLPDSHTICCSFRGYKALGKSSEGLFELINKEHPDKLVVDLRLNGGGDYTKGLKYLVHPIRDLPDINRKGAISPTMTARDPSGTGERRSGRLLGRHPRNNQSRPGFIGRRSE